MSAFLTGSHVYGTPTPESDIDVVVQMTEAEIETLSALSDGCFSFDEYGDGKSLRFGKLNIIAITGDNLFRLWRESTEECLKQKPVTKAAAKKMFQAREMAAKLGKKEAT